MDFSLGLPKLHEHPLPDEDALLDGCKMHGNLASKELVARSNQPQPLLCAIEEPILNHHRCERNLSLSFEEAYN